jgi:hypothetical protein
MVPTIWDDLPHRGTAWAYAMILKRVLHPRERCRHALGRVPCWLFAVRVTNSRASLPYRRGEHALQVADSPTLFGEINSA